MYILEFHGAADAQGNRPKELGLQDAAGNFTPLDVRFSKREDILDATPAQSLTWNRETGKISVHPMGGGTVEEIPMAGKIDFGKILSDEPGDVLLIGLGRLRHYRQKKIAWEIGLQGEGCAWYPFPGQAYQGLVQCGGAQIWKADLLKKTLALLPGISDKPMQISLDGEYLVLKYLDRFEVRKGPAFETVKWGSPGQLQEKLVLGHGHVYVVTSKGTVKSFQVDNGRAEWQRDMSANQLFVFENDLFVGTFAQTYVCLDAKGKLVWTYEYGWDNDPMLLPGEQSMVLHFGNGKRVKLNRELLGLTGNANEFKFMDYRAREAKGDWNGALETLDRILALEPGNGMAWKYRANLLRNLDAPRPEQLQSLTLASRSLDTPNWSAAPSLKGMATALGANWVWKRQYGPKFYPTLMPHKNLSYYLENDNQTLVLIDHETGKLSNSFRFSEDLDMKVSLWKNDTICVSSASRIYFLSPTQRPGALGQFPLVNPVCQAQTVAGGLVYSDWNGGLSMLGLPDKTLRWERKLGQTGLLVNKVKTLDYLDVIDMDGNYYAVSATSGQVLWSLRLPAGTVTEAFSGRDNVFAGYNQGALISIDRNRREVVWTRDFGEQIFSLSGNKDNTLVLTTASQKLFCVSGGTGAVQSQVHIQSYLFNRPTVIDHGYWIGTTEPALEKRNFNHELLFKYKLPDLPGSPNIFGNSIFIGTLDNFIFSFPT